MNKQLNVALIALAAQLKGSEAPAEAVVGLPFFKTFTPVATHRTTGWLEQARVSAESLRTAPVGAPEKPLLKLAEISVISGLRALLASTGCPESAGNALLLREGGRLIVKNSLPRPLSCYACGAYGDFSVHRLPLQGYVAGAHIASAEITAQQAMAAGLRLARKHKAIATRVAVQNNPSAAIRSLRTGKPLRQWGAEHWQQITWRLGYTTLFDLLTLAAEEATDAPATAELQAALVVVSDYCLEVFNAYAPAAPAYRVVGGAYAIAA